MDGVGDVRFVDCRCQRRGDVTCSDEVRFSGVCWKRCMFPGIWSGVVAAIFCCLYHACIMLFLQLSVQAAQITAERLMLVHDIVHEVVKEGNMGSVNGKNGGFTLFQSVEQYTMCGEGGVNHIKGIAVCDAVLVTCCTFCTFGCAFGGWVLFWLRRENCDEFGGLHHLFDSFLPASSGVID